jgi:hypothetical protein
MGVDPDDVAGYFFAPVDWLMLARNNLRHIVLDNSEVRKPDLGQSQPGDEQ